MMGAVDNLPGRPSWGPPEWAARGSCAAHPHPDWWYGQDDNGTVDHKLLDQAREVCRTCPVKHSCLIDALERGDREGMWGGTTPDERRRVTRLARDLHRTQEQKIA